jgi:hypothetical protein
MRSCLTFALLLLSTTPLAAADAEVIARGLKSPESVCLGKDGALYVTEIGVFGQNGDGQVAVIRDGKPVTFAKGFDDPKGITSHEDVLYVTDVTRVVKIDAKGEVTVLADADKFPIKPLFLNDIALEPQSGMLFVSDSGTLMGQQGAVFSIDIKTGNVELIVDSKSLPGLHTPNGLAVEDKDHLILADFGSGILHRINLLDKSVEKLADGLNGGDGLTWDADGHLYVSSWLTGKVFGIKKLGEKPVLLTDAFEQAADSCLDATGKFILIPDMKAGTLTAFPATIP